MTKLNGVIRGNIIELTEDPGLPVGLQVEVQVEASHSESKKPGEGFRRAAEIMAGEWTEEDDQIFEEIAQSRFDSLSRELPE